MNSLFTRIISIISTKGGVCKTTNTINIGSFLAESGLNVLLVDMDVRQPTLSSYYPLTYEAPCGIFEMLATNNINSSQIISKTRIPNLDLIKSNDSQGNLITMLSSMPDGYLRLRTLLRKIPGYDVIIIDTVGTRSIISDMSVLASHITLSPVLPEIISTREFLRGTLQIFRDLDTYREFNIRLPELKIVINRLDHTADAKDVASALCQIIDDQNQHQLYHIPVTVCDTVIPALVAYRRAATQQKPVYQHEVKEAKRIHDLCCELFPGWQKKFTQFYQALIAKKQRLAKLHS